MYFESSFMKSCRKQKSKLQIWPNSNEQCNIEGDLVGKEIFPPLETFLDKKKFLKFLEVYLQTWLFGLNWLFIATQTKQAAIRTRFAFSKVDNEERERGRRKDGQTDIQKDKQTQRSTRSSHSFVRFILVSLSHCVSPSFLSLLLYSCPLSRIYYVSSPKLDEVLIL